MKRALILLALLAACTQQALPTQVGEGPCPGIHLTGNARGPWGRVDGGHLSWQATANEGWVFTLCVSDGIDHVLYVVTDAMHVAGSAISVPSESGWHYSVIDPVEPDVNR